MTNIPTPEPTSEALEAWKRWDMYNPTTPVVVRTLAEATLIEAALIRDARAAEREARDVIDGIDCATSTKGSSEA